MTRTVAMLIYPEFQLLDAAGPLAAFEVANGHVPGTYDLRVVAMVPGPVRSSSGAVMMAGAAAELAAVDTLIVSGGQGTREAAVCPITLGYLRTAPDRMRRVASVCSGSYILAAAGLLDGRRATTHWVRSADFRRRFPAVDLDADRIFVQDGPFWTSAGITAGIDLALAMIAADLGEDVARRTAEYLVVYYRRPGGQSQFSALQALPAGRFGAVLAFARENLHLPLTVEQLADRAGMSPRNFARLFVQDTGSSPARVVERLRIEAARTLLDGTSLRVEEIAARTGFGDPERMRRAFRRVLGQPPQALRRPA